MKILLLAGFFCLTALIYAAVGFGGGSTYTAVLIMSGVDFRLIPIIALACNILVVSGNVFHYHKNGFIDFKKIWPLIILSVPAAWLGGRLDISETSFTALLAIALMAAGLRLLFYKPVISDPEFRPASKPLNALIGGAIGFYSGLVGIGGGIFLAPILHFSRWRSAKSIAAACSFFILVNSASGIAGHGLKLRHYVDDNALDIIELLAFWPVIPAVIIGGLIGNRIGTDKFSETALKRLTGALILVVAIRLTWLWVAMALGTK